MLQESPTCNLFPASKSPASSPLARSTPPVRGKAGPSGRATASEKTWAAKLWVSGRREDAELTLKFLCSSPPGPPTSVRPVLAPQPSTSNSQRLSRPQGAAAKPSSRLPVPSAIPRPASRMPLTGRSVPSSKGALPPDSLPARKGLPRPSAAGHRGEKSGHKDKKSGGRVPTPAQHERTLPELVAVTFSTLITALFEDGKAELRRECGPGQSLSLSFQIPYVFYLGWEERH